MILGVIKNKLGELITGDHGQVDEQSDAPGAVGDTEAYEAALEKMLQSQIDKHKARMNLNHLILDAIRPSVANSQLQEAIQRSLDEDELTEVDEPETGPEANADADPDQGSETENTPPSSVETVP